MPAINKAAFEPNLNLSDAWVGTYTQTDVLTWVDTSLGGVLTIPTTNIDVDGAGGGVNILGSLNSQPITINGTGTNGLLIGTAGIDIASTGVDLTLNCRVACAGAQTWTVATGKTITLTGTISSTGIWTKNGLGTFIFSNPDPSTTTFSLGLRLDTGTVIVGSKLTTTSTFGIGSSGTEADYVYVENQGRLEATSGGTLYTTIGGAFTSGTTFPPTVLRNRNSGFLPGGGGGSQFDIAHSVYIGNATTNTVANTYAALVIDTPCSSVIGGSLVSGYSGTTANGFVPTLIYVGGYLQLGGVTGTTDIVLGDAGHRLDSPNVLDCKNGQIICADIFIERGLTGIAHIRNGSSLYARTGIYVSGSATSTTAYGILNVLDSTIETPVLNGDNNAAVGTVNFNNATFINRLTAGSATVPHIDHTFVREGGLKWNQWGTTGIVRVNNAFKTQSGTVGVTGISITPGTGTGYKAPPVIVIGPPSSGGVRATAVVEIDWEGSGDVTDIIITNPGSGYDVSAPPTVQVFGGIPNTALMATCTTDILGDDGEITINGDIDPATDVNYKGRVRFSDGVLAANNTFAGSIYIASGEFGTESGTTLGRGYNLPNVSSITIDNNASFSMVSAGNVENLVSSPISGSGSVFFSHNSAESTTPRRYTTFSDLAGLSAYGVAKTLSAASDNDYSILDVDGIKVPGFWSLAVGDASLYRGAYVKMVSLPYVLGYAYREVDTSFPSTSYVLSDSGTHSTEIQLINFDLSSTGGISPVAELRSDGYNIIYGYILNVSSLNTNASFSLTRKAPVSVSLQASTNCYLGIYGDIDILDAHFTALTVNSSVNNGTVEFTGDNKFGSLDVRGGVLKLSSPTAHGVDPESSSTKSVFGSSTLQVNSDIDMGSAGLQMAGGSTIYGAMFVDGGSFSLTIGSLTLLNSSTVRVDTDCGLTLNATGRITGTNFGLSKIGQGVFANRTAVSGSVFGGPVTIAEGTFDITQLAVGTVASHIGQSNNSDANLTFGATAGIGGTLKYSGAVNATTDRAFRVKASGGTIESSGTGTITWTGQANLETTSSNLTLSGSNSGYNWFQGTITGSGSLRRAGTGSWIVNPMNVNGSNTMNGATLDGSGDTVLMADVDFDTSTSTGRILGSGDVLVKTGHHMKTATGSNQFGRARYDGNLTFEGGSSLTIGWRET
jgi:hypothetical protein